MKKIDFKFVFLFLLSTFLIFFKFNEIPTNISFDEIEFAQLAKSLNHNFYSPYSTLATGHSTLYFYILLFFFKIFGVSNFALRLPSAIFGIVGALMFYQVMKVVFNPPSSHFKFPSSILPILSSLILISSRWYLNFARFSFEATFLLFLELTSLLFFIKYLKDQDIKKVYLSSFFAGLSFLSYTPGRLFFLLPLIFLLFKKLKKEALIYLFIFLITISPLLTYFLNNQDRRVHELIVSTPNMVIDNIKKISLMFHFNGDMNGRHNYPGKAALNPILGLIFLVGLIQGLKNIHKQNNQLFAGFLLLSLIPALLTVPKDNPNMLRTVTVLPSIAYFSVLPLIRISNLKTKFKNFILFVTCILLLVSCLYELRTYFVFQSRVMKNSFEIKCSIEKVISYKLKEIPKNCRVNKNEF